MSKKIDPKYPELKGLKSELESIEQLRYITRIERERLVYWLDTLLTEKAMELPYQN